MHLSTKLLSGKVGGQNIIIKTKNQCDRTVNFISSAGNFLALPAGGQMGQHCTMKCTYFQSKGKMVSCSVQQN